MESLEEPNNATDVVLTETENTISCTYVEPHPKETKPLGTAVGGKNLSERKAGVNIEEKSKTENDLEITELLGSVTRTTQNCPGTRTSARVIQKMKQDQIRPTTPPPSDKKDERTTQKTPSQVRKPTWTNLERNHFFDALNEFGKDFDSIGNYINAKLKRKSSTDISFKTKDQIRQHYHQTYHKICKYIKFSDEIKKLAQELYALINYGEMRRKLQFVTDKHFMKLRNLVYHGHITVRCKGKNIRVKTPSCKALRRLNQLDDSLEDIRLPSKIEVIVSPCNMEAFARVQSIAQNPRARTTVPLHKKLVNFINAFQYKWRSTEMKLSEEELKLFPSSCHDSSSTQPSSWDINEKGLPVPYQDPEMCFLPKPGVTIHRPLLSITEYLGSVNICLSAYEERMGVKVKGETLSVLERPSNKRQRTESGSDKRSPESKKQKALAGVSPEQKNDTNEIQEASEVNATNSVAFDGGNMKNESSGDELSDEINELLSDCLKKEKTISNSAETSSVQPSNSSASIETYEVAFSNLEVSAETTASVANTTNSVVGSASAASIARSKRANATQHTTKSARVSLSFKPLISEEVIKTIRKGWTISNAADLTIGDLYVVLGQDSKLELEYFWKPPATASAAKSSSCSLAIVGSSSNQSDSMFLQKSSGMPYNPSECDDTHLLNTLASSSIGNKLKHLLLIANLSERIRKRQCSCGHICDRNAAKARIERDLAKTFVSSKSYNSSNNGDSYNGNGIFRQPNLPLRRPAFSLDPVKQPNALSRQKMSRQVLVQRLLLPGGANQSYDLLNVNHLQNSVSHFKEDERPSSSNLSPSTAAGNNSVACNDNSINEPPHFKAIRNVTNFAEPSSADDSTFFKTLQIEDTQLLPSTSQSGISDPMSSLPDSDYDECSNTSIFNGLNPINLIRDSTSNSRWLEENLNDFSLTSLLGHLDEINASRDILDPSSNLSVISESSVDYMHKFQEISALMQSQEKE